MKRVLSSSHMLEQHALTNVSQRDWVCTEHSSLTWAQWWSRLSSYWTPESRTWRSTAPVSDEHQTLHMKQKKTTEREQCWPVSDPSEREPSRGAAWRRPPRRKCCAETSDPFRHTCHTVVLSEVPPATPLVLKQILTARLRSLHTDADLLRVLLSGASRAQSLFKRNEN